MAYIKCGNCGHVNFDSASKCERCNADLASGIALNDSAQLSAAKLGAAQYYKSTGKVTLLGLVWGLVGGGAVGVVGAVIYPYIISNIPFVYFNLICTVGYGAALGASVAKLMKWGKVRNTTVCVLVASVVAVLSFYLSWAVWMAITLSVVETSVSWFTLAQDPLALSDLIVRVNEVGTWSLRNQVVSGVALVAVWAVEALIVLIGSPVMAWYILTSEPFCEACLLWCQKDPKILAFEVLEPAELKRRIEAKDFEYLKAVRTITEGSAEWYQFELDKCPNCNNTNTLTVKIKYVQIDKKGNPEVKTKGFIKRLLLSATEVSHLQRVGAEVFQSNEKSPK